MNSSGPITVAVDGMVFHRRCLSGTKSAFTHTPRDPRKVTEATFTFVAMDESGSPRVAPSVPGLVRKARLPR